MADGATRSPQHRLHLCDDRAMSGTIICVDSGLGPETRLGFGIIDDAGHRLKTLPENLISPGI